MEIIRKYKNRKYYSTRDSEYLNLEDIAKRIITDSDFRVLESRFGTDVTKETIRACLNKKVELNESFMKMLIKKELTDENRA